MSSRVGAVRDWAAGFPGCGGLLKLNALVEQDGDSALQAEATDVVTRSNIDGSEEREVTFSLLTVLPWSEGHDGINAEASERAEQWCDWCAAQWPRNVPDMPGCEVTGIEPVYATPDLYAVNETERVAVYRLSVKIRYTKEATEWES